MRVSGDTEPEVISVNQKVSKYIIRIQIVFLSMCMYIELGKIPTMTLYLMTLTARRLTVAYIVQ